MSVPGRKLQSNVNQKGDIKPAKDSTKKKDEDIVFETFYHRSGKEFQCIYQSGMRFYLDDWASKEWMPFPKRWYNEGLLVTNTILKNEKDVKNSQDAPGHDQSPRPQRSGDDREGFLMHPSKGRIPTYIFYQKHNVHMYFDRDTGSWVRMPIAWELHHDMVKSLVDQVEESVPTWGDRHDILALLRACNYDPDECISIYLHLQKDEWMKENKKSNTCEILQEKEKDMVHLEQCVKDMEVTGTDSVPGRKLSEMTQSDSVQEKESSSTSNATKEVRPKFLNGPKIESEVSGKSETLSNQQEVLSLKEENANLKAENAALKTLLSSYLQKEFA